MTRKWPPRKAFWLFLGVCAYVKSFHDTAMWLVTPPEPPPEHPEPPPEHLGTPRPEPFPFRTRPERRHEGRSVLIFTMDSLPGYMEHAKRGGPAGELVVRNSLQAGLDALGVSYTVAGSDAEFERLFRAQNYSHLILDEWTVVDSSLRVRVEHPRVFALAFFGMGAGHMSGLPSRRFLAAYPYPSMNNTFLGYMVAAPPPPAVAPRLGVIWGKLRSYFAGREPLLVALASAFPELELVTTLADGEPPLGGRVRNLGPLPSAEWRALLGNAVFLLGLGHPLGGPSALDALAAGAVYIDPSHNPPPAAQPHFHSQHPYLRGHPRVCSVDLQDHASVFACVAHALNASTRTAYVPPDFTRAAYLRRLERLLDPSSE